MRFFFIFIFFEGFWTKGKFGSRGEADDAIVIETEMIDAEGSSRRKRE
jgi:hypothetical protein